MTDPIDFAIIGGGPAGQAAARAAIRHQLRVTILDEQLTPGGQIYRQPYRQDIYPEGRFGQKHVQATQSGEALVREPLVSWCGGRMVWGLAQRPDGCFDIACSGAAGSETLVAKRVLVATGCHDMPVPFPGWTLPGVMGAGGIQALLKGQGILPGKRIVLGGSHPLMLVIASQLLDFGVRPAGVLFAQSRRRALAALTSPITALRSLPVFAQGAKAYQKLRCAGVPVQFDRLVVSAEGMGELERVRIASTPYLDGDAEAIDCDTFGFCYGFSAASDLPRQVGAESCWVETGGGWIISHDPRMESSLSGLYVAGESAGIGGEPCASAEGYLAGLTIAKSLKIPVASSDILRAQKLRRRRRAFAALLQSLADPGEILIRELRDQTTLICRCESVSTGALRDILADNPSIRTANAAKLLARTGMGPCQGRFCHCAVQQEIAAARQSDIATVGGFTSRLPARPVPLRDLL